MAKNYKIKVSIQIVDSDQDPAPRPTKIDPGQFEIVISAEQAINIDECEQALLQTNYAALREAIANHLTELSKKKRLKWSG